MTGLIDTHLHLIYPDIAGYSWTDGIPPLANQAFTLPDYLGLIDGLNVDGALFMEAGVDDADYQAETRFIAGLDGLVGLIASCRPEVDTGFEAWLDECTSLNVKGYRRILHVMPDDLSQSTTFRSNIRKIGARNLSFDVCVLAGQLPIALELAMACDATQLVLNHCGVPDIAGAGLDPWRADISALAALPHVACKVSGLLAYCPPNSANLATIRPYIEHVIAEFGPDRLVWGSDWPVVNLANGLTDWISVTREIMAELSADEAAALAGGTAQRLYRL